MATIYSAPEHIKAPVYDWVNETQNDWTAKENKYLEELRAFCLSLKKGKHIGEVIKFPVADGYAQYMIASMRPVELIHLEIMDAYSFPFAQLLTATEIKEKINQEAAVKELFGPKG